MAQKSLYGLKHLLKIVPLEGFHNGVKTHQKIHFVRMGDSK